MLTRFIPVIASALLLQACWHSSEAEPGVCGSVFPSDLPATAPVIYVLAEVEAGGDGSFEHPFATVAEGLEVARPGDVVAVGEGTYDEEVTIGSGVTLSGACPDGTILTSSTPEASDSEGVVTIAGADVEVRAVTITSTVRSAVVAAGVDRDARLSDVVLSGQRHAVLAADGAALSLESFHARDSTCGLAIEGGELDLLDGYVERNAIGACLDCAAVESELDWLGPTVRFARNELNLSSLESCP